MNITASSIHKSSSVIALHNLLMEVVKHPNSFLENHELKIALKSQGGIASFKYYFSKANGENFQKSPMSLNTLKTYADTCLPIKFKGLNSLRLQAIDAINFTEKHASRENRRTKSGLTVKVKQLEYELEMLRRSNLILLQALSSAMSQFTSIKDAPDEKIRAKRTADALQLIRVIVGMTNTDIDENQSKTLEPNNQTSRSIADIDSYRNRK